MAALDAWSYRLRSPDRDWRKVIDSLKSGVWDENIDLTEAPKE
jgi:hypothetical protein